MRKVIAVIFLIFMMLFVSCSNNDEVANTEPMNNENVNEVDDSDTSEPLVFNSDTLSAYNGKDGNPAYIAIEGVVYDVSDEPMWMDGIHQGRFEAGQDLTEQMKNAPHGFSKLTGLKEVGSYED